MNKALLNIGMALLLCACGSNPPVDVTLDELKAGEFDNDSIRVSGIIGLTTVIYGDEPTFVLYTGNGENRVTCDMIAGESKNQMRPLPDEFAIEDVWITDKNGETIRYGDAVTLTGYVTSVGESKYIDVAAIEKK